MSKINMSKFQTGQPPPCNQQNRIKIRTGRSFQSSQNKNMAECQRRHLLINCLLIDHSESSVHFKSVL